MDLSSIPEHVLSAVHALEGKTLASGWKVLKQAKRKAGSTGGNFSVCYHVEKEGKKGFLKAINILSFLRDDEDDLLKATTDSLNTFTFERDLMQKCSDRNLSKVSRLLDSGNENFSGHLIKNVYYLIFELADGDVREHINFSDSIDIAWKLRSLHNIVTGINQLHSIDIAHQDIKPSNIFVYDKLTSKLGDLGRSLSREIKGPHSKQNFTGDWKYAPPEIYHRYYVEEWSERVQSIDCYLIGSMASYYLTGQSMTALLISNISDGLDIWSLKFEQALPYWVESFEKSLKEIENNLKGYPQKDDLILLIRMLCNPNPKHRGHAKNQKNGNRYALERFITSFNVLATKAEFKLVK